MIQYTRLIMIIMFPGGDRWPIRGDREWECNLHSDQSYHASRLDVWGWHGPSQGQL